MGFLEFVFTFLLPPFLALFLLMKYRFRFWQNRGVPTTSPNTPLGDLSELGRKYHLSEQSEIWYRDFKSQGRGFGGLFSMLNPILMVTDLELVKHIFIKDFPHFTDRDFYFNEKDDPLSVNLLSLEGDRWRRRRNLLSPIFTSGKLKNMFPLVVQKSELVVKAVEQSVQSKTPLESLKLSRDFTLQSIGSCAFGVDLHNDTDELTKLVELAFGGNDPFGIVRFLFMSHYPDLARKLGIRLNDKRVDDFVVNMIGASIQYRKENGVRRNDLLDLLLDIQREQKLGAEEDFSFLKLVAECSLFFFGGFETSAGTMSWALYELANNQECQSRLRDEIRRVKARHEGQITYEAISEMEYLQQVFNETLRLWPPFATASRKVSLDYRIPNTDVLLKKGTVVWIPTYAIQRDPEYYENPTVFNPDNFAPEAVRERNSMTFLPFSEGPRNCVGLRFAQLQTKLGIAKVIDSFRISVNSKTKLPIKMDLKQQVNPIADGGLWLDFEKA